MSAIVKLGVAVAMTLLLVAGPVLHGTGASAALRTASVVSVTPKPAAAGGQIKVQGSGFAAKSRGSIRIDNRTYTKFTTDASGKFSSTVTLPATMKTGTRRLTATVGWKVVATTFVVAQPQAVTSPANEAQLWGLIGNDGQNLSEERAAGINTRLFNLSWREFAPQEGTVDPWYLQRKRQEMNDLRAAGFKLILSLGFHDSPHWVHANYPDTYYVNQYGNRYIGEAIDSGNINLVFNQQMRSLAAGYFEQVFAEFGTDFVAVRLGGGRYDELTYPPAVDGSTSNNYWSFDANAIAQSPVPGWKPGDPSPNQEAARYLDWYLNKLVEYQNWQIATVRTRFSGPIMMLYPSWGIRPGQIEMAVAGNLSGSTSAEINGEIQRGFDFARQIGAITDPNIVVTTTWLDADATALAYPGDASTNPAQWSPVKYLAYLADRHPLKLRKFGENTGQGSRRQMDFSVSQMKAYGLYGMLWYREDEMLSGRYATLDDYKTVISAYKP